MEHKNPPTIMPASQFPTSEQPVVMVVDVMLRCKLDNQVMPASMALEHQQMHIKKGEDPCFVIETAPGKQKGEESTRGII
ncbi:hypothetical protein [Acidianus ambivalens]|uniref:Uncharacterized protein n=1 Tax=Acidianus ambivalens TaxID=2283 RepID=A0A650CW97_ACIAM|nr:hypothetical protein [Acidianus ambivalens]MQL56510.1 hypothetical protein [Acidianus ambivalens]QGR21965.1 hypothetical protein D1866_08065 [Acidianus ambivalens]